MSKLTAQHILRIPAVVDSDDFCIAYWEDGKLHSIAELSLIDLKCLAEDYLRATGRDLFSRYHNILDPSDEF